MNFFSKFYPLFSIAGIQLTNFLDDARAIFVFLLQVAIGLLTLYKLWQDIKKRKEKKKKDADDTEQSI